MESSNASGAAVGGSSSSDFVRKLHKMLEDPNNRNFVRWSDKGDSFIVVDTNDFTKTILPQHFKHTNFASFVRQLNKYDFHKIRNTDEGESSRYGGDAWEFKHPDFTMHNKNNLDNIRRKAPASKSKQQGEVADRQEMDQAHARIQSLVEAQSDMSTRMQRLIETNHTLYTEVSILSDSVQEHNRQLLQHRAVIGRILEHLEKSTQAGYAPKRNNGQSDNPGDTGTSPQGNDAPPNSMNETSPILQQAQQMMEQRPDHPQQQHNSAELGAGYEPYGGPNRPSQNGPRPLNGIPGVGPNAPYVHPSGPTPGNGEAYDNSQSGINYHMEPPAQGNLTPQPARPMPGRKKSTPFSPNWTSSPRVLLVEDDPTCARIGSKFLTSAQCTCDIASDGLQAIHTLSNNKYDLVLMDIMMPNLDGCSAAALVRDFDQKTPIIAMTSNIRREEINTYFQNGMNDVLPKPFTKEGLLQTLERTLPHLMANKSAPQIPPQLSFSDAENRISDTVSTAPMSANSLAYSASPAASRSPGTTGIYGPGRSPTDIGEDPVGHGHTPNAVEDGSGYSHGMGGYIEGNGHPYEHNSSYSSPTNSNRGQRRGRSDMEGGEDGNMNYANAVIKKQRF